MPSLLKDGTSLYKVIFAQFMTMKKTAGVLTIYADHLEGNFQHKYKMIKLVLTEDG